MGRVTGAPSSHGRAAGMGGHTPYTLRKALPSWPSSRVPLGTSLPPPGPQFPGWSHAGGLEGFP